MKSMKRSYFLLCICIVLLSCEKKNHISTKTVDISGLTEENLFSFKRPIDNCRFVALQTDSNYLIGNIEKLIIENNRIFVKDDCQNLFVFGLDGNYLSKIGNIGQGNKDLLALSDFYVNTEANYVGVYDDRNAKIVRYGFDGKYISSHNCITKMVNCRNIIGYSQGNLFLTMTNSIDSKLTYMIIKESDYSFVREMIPYKITGSMPCSPAGNTACLSVNGFYGLSFFSDTIYKFDQNILKPLLFIKSDSKTPDNELFNQLQNENYRICTDAYPTLRKKGYSTGLNYIYSTDEYLYTSLPLPGYQSCEIFYHLKSGQAYKSTTDRSDFFGNSWGPPVACTSNEIVHILTPERAIQLRENPELFSNKRIIQNLKDVKEFDNPVLVFFTSGYGKNAN